ncbi:hypothetical protein [Gemmatimonas sp.]|jgi:hypothetical protein
MVRAVYVAAIGLTARPAHAEVVDAVALGARHRYSGEESTP